MVEDAPAVELDGASFSCSNHAEETLARNGQELRGLKQNPETGYRIGATRPWS